MGINEESTRRRRDCIVPFQVLEIDPPGASTEDVFHEMAYDDETWEKLCSNYTIN